MHSTSLDVPVCRLLDRRVSQASASCPRGMHGQQDGPAPCHAAPQPLQLLGGGRHADGVVGGTAHADGAGLVQQCQCPAPRGDG